jgi:hypothetical protein
MALGNDRLEMIIFPAGILFPKKMPILFKSIAEMWTVVVFLAIYAVSVVLMFRKVSGKRRRRLDSLDYVWIPLGGLTGICLVELWWRMR